MTASYLRLAHILNRLLILSLLVFPAGLFASVPVPDEDTARAVSLYEAGDVEEAVRLLAIKAHEGLVDAQFNLGVINAIDAVSDPALTAEAVYWFRQAANAGHVGAQFNLAAMLQRQAAEEEDEIRSVDLMAEAIRWLESAANRNYRRAQFNLGMLAWSEWGDFIGQAQGEEWIRRAVSRGAKRATVALDAIHQTGDPGDIPVYGPVLKLISGSSGRTVKVRNNATPAYAFPARRQQPVMELRGGTVVEVVGARKGWVSVRLAEGFPSWIKGDEVQVENDQARVIGLEGSLMLEPVLDRDVFRVGTVVKSESLRVISREDGWVQVQTPRRFLAWLREDALVVTTAEQAVVAENDVIFGGTPAAESEAPEAAEASTGEPAALLPAGEPKTVISALPVYDADGDGARLIGVLEPGDTLSLLSSSGDYSEINSAEGFGAWIYGKFLEVDGGQGTVTGSVVRVRVKPATTEDATVIGQISRGAAVRVREHRNGWYRIVIDAGERGWVRDLAAATQ